MATITVDYDVRNRQMKSMAKIIPSLGLVGRMKSGLEEALEDVASGRLTTIHTPKNWKAK